MLQLLKIEWLKIRTYRAFWWVIGITAITYPAVSFIMVRFYKQVVDKLPAGSVKMVIGNPFAFNEVWHTVAYFSSLFILVPAIVVIMLMTNEYSFKTQRQNIIDGWSRRQFLTGKLLDVLVVSLLITVLYILTSVFIGMKNTAVDDIAGVNKSYFIIYFLLQTFSQLSIAFFIGFVLRRSFIALGVFIFLLLIVEPLVGWMLSYIHGSMGYFLPFEISDRMIPPPAFFGKMDPAAYQLSMNNSGYHVFYTIIFTFLLWLYCYSVNGKKDL